MGTRSLFYGLDFRQGFYKIKKTYIKLDIIYKYKLIQWDIIHYQVRQILQHPDPTITLNLQLEDLDKHLCHFLTILDWVSVDFGLIPSPTSVGSLFGKEVWGL